MPIRLYTGKRRKLKATRERDEIYGLAGSMQIIDGKSTDLMKHVNIAIGEDYYLEIDREDLIEAYEFLIKPRGAK